MQTTGTDFHTSVALPRVQKLAESVYQHPALNNPFYDLWRSEELNAGQVEIVARNFYAQVAPTADRIALVFLRMASEDVEARAETVENLNDELGLGDPKKVHTVLLKTFFSELVSHVRGRKVTFDEIDPAILPSTQRLVEHGARLFGDERVQVGSGALLAQEWHAYPQLVYLYEGARNYLHHFELEEFHEHCEYFYLHIGSAEKEHKLHSISTAASLCRTPEELAALERGFTGYLDLLAEFWQGLHDAVRVPAAAGVA